jgi:hypothetical protein
MTAVAHLSVDLHQTGLVHGWLILSHPKPIN